MRGGVVISNNGAVKRARWAVLTVFFVNGAVLASWVPHIPFVKAGLELSPSLLGLALLAIAAGALVAMPAAGLWVAKVGSRRMTTLATLLFCCALPLSLLAPSLPLLALALFFFGAGNGSMDVSMNAQAVAVEGRFGRAIMSSFHAMFSVGGLVGASVAGVVVALGMSPVAHVFIAAVVLALIALTALRHFLPAEVDAAPQAPPFILPRRALLGLGLVAFFALVGEGAIGDWSAVYLTNVLGTEPSLAAAGYAAFSLTMALGRSTGDFLVQRFGPVALMRASGLVAALGLGLGLLLAHPLAAILGFAAVGAGLSNTIPILFSAAGRSREMAPGPALAAVATTGYLGLLSGPVMIGGLADVAGLPVGLGLVVLFSLFVAALAPLLGRN